MSRQRVHKGAAKRFKVTKNGKVLRRSHYLRHLRANKSKRQVRGLKTVKEIDGVAGKKIRQMLGLA